MTYVLGVAASPRKKGNTDHLVQSALAGAAAAGAATEEIQLRDYSITPCLGCEQCQATGLVCPRLKDGMQLLYPKITECQGLILASPTHNYNVTAWMKAFIDRLYCFFQFTDDRPRGYTSRLGGRGRKAVILAVCEQTDPKDMGFTLEAMRAPLEALGYEVVGQLPVYGLFDRGIVRNHAEIISEAEKLGRNLALSLARAAANQTG